MNEYNDNNMPMIGNASVNEETQPAFNSTFHDIQAVNA